MKKSEIFKAAQISVLNDTRIVDYADKLAILKELMEREDVAVMMEEKEDTENGSV